MTDLYHHGARELQDRFDTRRLADRLEQVSWEAGYRPLLIDGDRAVATGETRYADGRVFFNLYVLRFDGDGRCSEFVEWFMEQRQRP